jgi:hypothetical protein
MPTKLTKIRYPDLNSRQQESFNYQKISGVLADYGFVTIRLSDDWKGADFLAQHIQGQTLRVQLKSRLAIHKKYQGKDLWICFRYVNDWYLFPHDEVLERILTDTNVPNTKSWKNTGGYTVPHLSKQLRAILASYRLSP